MKDNCEPLEIVINHLHKDFELWIFLILQILILSVRGGTLDVDFNVLHQVIRNKNFLIASLLANDGTRVKMQFKSFSGFIINW